uniref:Uncharacterized protein n=1 Tax=Marseillevirus LCMAC201 TaxID=2506605 RepID=A0A481YX49_9VIRU|nr:MAG: hypothetical protein LCMAC201_03670 [Marseillevirus LCMAC201]
MNFNPKDYCDFELLTIREKVSKELKIRAEKHFYSKGSSSASQIEFSARSLDNFIKSNDFTPIIKKLETNLTKGDLDNEITEILKKLDNLDNKSEEYKYNFIHGLHLILIKFTEYPTNLVFI